jgi:hypothetical protein
MLLQLKDELEMVISAMPQASVEIESIMDAVMLAVPSGNRLSVISLATTTGFMVSNTVTP